MVSTTVEKLTPTRVKLTISVSPEELKPSIDHAYQHIAREVTIPGFRKGKVPPPIIDQRVGRAEVLSHAVNEGLDSFYREAAIAEDVKPVGRPEADIVELPDAKTFAGDLKITIEVDVRPEFEVPDYKGLVLTVEPAAASDADIDAELENLRTRFGTLVTVDRPAKTGDFLTLDLTATIGDETVDTASNISYELGSGELIEGIDDALDTLTAGEKATFEAPLLGGDHEGETAQIDVTLLTVKERELPDADDEFAQIASQFDTLAELRDDLRTQLGTQKAFGQASEARDQIVDVLLEKVDIPVPPALVEDEVHRHLEQENRLEDDEHRREVTESSEKSFRSQVLLDAIAEKEGVQVSQDELTTYLVQAAAQYGMEPQQFAAALDEQGQLPAMIGEVARSKTLAVILGQAKVVDTDGKPVDVSRFTAVETPGDAAAEAAAAAEQALAEADASEPDASELHPATVDAASASVPAGAPADDSAPKKRAPRKKKDAAEQA